MTPDQKIKKKEKTIQMYRIQNYNNYRGYFCLELNYDSSPWILATKALTTFVLGHLSKNLSLMNSEGEG